MRRSTSMRTRDIANLDRSRRHAICLGKWRERACRPRHVNVPAQSANRIALRQKMLKRTWTYVAYCDFKTNAKNQCTCSDARLGFLWINSTALGNAFCAPENCLPREPLMSPMIEMT